MTAPFSPSLDRPTVVFAALLKISSQLKSSGTSAFGILGLGYLDARIIFALGQGPRARAAQIANRLGVDSAAVSRTLKSLRQRKLVSVDEKLCPTLTNVGVELYGEIARLLDARFERLTTGFSDRDVEQLIALLDRLQSNLPALFDLALSLAEVPPTSPVRAPVLAAQQEEAV